MLTVHCQEYFDEVEAAAKVAGTEAAEAFTRAIEYLRTFGGSARTFDVHLFKDFAPYSFGVLIRHPAKLDGDLGSVMCNGGLIYEGPGLAPNDVGNRGDGSGPAFSVSLNCDPSKHAWRMHT